MNKKSELIRGYCSGDEINIIRLYRKIFKPDIDLKTWEWKFLEHNQGKGWHALAEVNSDIVGVYSIMRNHLNFIGKEIVAGQSCDTMVRSDQRGKKWFTRLADRNYGDSSSSGLEVVFGFPNRNSYPGFMKYLGWSKIFNLRYYYFRIGLRRLLGNKFDDIFKLFLSVILRGIHRIYKILYTRNQEFSFYYFCDTSK